MDKCEKEAMPEIVSHFGRYMCDRHENESNVCPACGNDLVFEEGCKRCLACGWGACGN